MVHYLRPDGTLDGDALLRARRRGLSCKQLAALVGTRADSIAGVTAAAAKRLGVALPRAKREGGITPAMERRALLLRKQCLSWPAIARELGVSEKTARRASLRGAARSGEVLPKGDYRAQRTIDAERALALRHQGMGWRQIAQLLGHQAQGVQRAVARYAAESGIPMPVVTPPRPPPIVDGKRALKLRREKRMSWTAIAKVLGCHSSTARVAAEREAMRHGELLPPPRQRVLVDKRSVRALRAQGLSWKAVAVRLGCSTSGAFQALRKKDAHARPRPNARGV